MITPSLLMLLFQQLVNALVHFEQCEFLSCATRHQPDNHSPNGLKECCFKACPLIHQASAEGKSLFEKKSLFHIHILCSFVVGQLMFCNTLSEYVVYTAVDGFCLVQIRTDQELCIVKSIEQVSANFQLFKELGICRLADIGIAVVLLIP